MEADKIKLLFTYVIAGVIVVGGGLMLYAIRLDPPESQSATLSLAIAGFIGAAIAFVFGQESATRASRAADASAQAERENVRAWAEPLEPIAADVRFEQPDGPREDRPEPA